MNDPFEIPSLEEIQEMERQRLQAIESLQISESGNSVKCQRCGFAVPIVDKLSSPCNDRTVILQRQIKLMENYRRGGYGNANASKDEDLKALRQELSDLMEEDAKYDKLRSLPLYSCRITGWKFVCSKCYDKVYTYAIAKAKPHIPQ